MIGRIKQYKPRYYLLTGVKNDLRDVAVSPIFLTLLFFFSFHQSLLLLLFLALAKQQVSTIQPPTGQLGYVHVSMFMGTVSFSLKWAPKWDSGHSKENKMHNMPFRQIQYYFKLLHYITGKPASAKSHLHSSNPLLYWTHPSSEFSPKNLVIFLKSWMSLQLLGKMKSSLINRSRNWCLMT